MKTENPAALHFIMHDDIYLLDADKPLYSAQLQATPVETAPIDETPPVSFNYLGKNKKSFLIIVSYPGHDFIPDAHLTSLQNILNRMGHNMDDIALVNRAKHAEANFDTLITFFNPKKLLLLGNEAVPAGMERPAINRPKQIDQCNALFSFSFDEMMDSNDNKKAFWEQMKQL